MKTNTLTIDEQKHYQILIDRDKKNKEHHQRQQVINQLFKIKAKQSGIVVTDEEVNDEMRKRGWIE